MDSRQPIIALIDDDPAYLESLSAVVQTMGFEPRAFTDAQAFLAARAQTEFDCVIADIKMPEMDGLSLLDQLADDPLAPPVIFITGHGEVPGAVRAMRRGAIAYLQKNMFGETTLWEHIHQALARGAERRVQHERQQDLQRRLAAITPPERQVLELLVRGRDHTRIAEMLGVSRRTVENRRSKLMKKLGVTTFPALVRLAVEAGLQDADGP